MPEEYVESYEILLIAFQRRRGRRVSSWGNVCACLLYTSDAADERSSVDLGGRRIIKKKKKKKKKFFFFFFKQKTAYEMLRSLVGSEMCIRDRLFSGGVAVAFLHGVMYA